MRKVAVLTGSRGEYSIYTSVLNAIDERSDLDYELIVTGMHLSERFGHTVDEIEKDGRKIGAKVPMLKYKDTLAGMIKNTGVAIIGIAEDLEKIKPDIIHSRSAASAFLVGLAVKASKIKYKVA